MQSRTFQFAIVLVNFIRGLFTNSIFGHNTDVMVLPALNYSVFGHDRRALLNTQINTQFSAQSVQTKEIWFKQEGRGSSWSYLPPHRSQEDLQICSITQRLFFFFFFFFFELRRSQFTTWSVLAGGVVPSKLRYIRPQKDLKTPFSAHSSFKKRLCNVTTKTMIFFFFFKNLYY